MRTRPYRLERWARDFGTGGEDENVRVVSTSEVSIHHGWSLTPRTEEELEELEEEILRHHLDADLAEQSLEEHYATLLHEDYRMPVEGDPRVPVEDRYEQAVQEREQAARGYEHDEEQGWE